MAVKIRLRRMGSRNAAFYRVIVQDARYAPTGRFIETLGWYDPKQEVIHSVELFHDYIQEGRIKLKEKIKEPTTVQDPCNVVRSGGLGENNRRLAEALSEDFRPMNYQGNYIVN